MASLMAEFRDRKIDYEFVWTGQHRETIDEILKNFKIKKPDKDLYEGQEVKSLWHGIYWTVGLAFKALFAKKGKGEGIVLVHGDAVSAIIGMLYGKSKGYKIGTVEAGLRSFNYFKPFPEEIVRVILSHFTDFHFAPGDWAANNLKKRKGKIINTGLNTLYDSLRVVICPRKENDTKYAVVNLHRFENIQNKTKLRMLIESIVKVSKKIKILFILHPSTEYQLKKFDLLKDLKKKEIQILPRQNYATFINYVINSEFLITDGGSNQEETSYFGHPCLILRGETERQEGIGKNAVISNLDKETILDFADNYEKYCCEPIKPQKSPTKIIVDFLESEI